MLKGFVLLVAAVIARSGNTTGTQSQPATATVPPSPQLPSPTPEPTPVPQQDGQATTGEPAVPENVLVEALVGRIVKLNPLLATYNPVDRDITSLIFEGLTTTNEYGEIIPDLAESWVVSSDGLQYVVILRDDVLWQDGIPFTARDVCG